MASGNDVIAQLEETVKFLNERGIAQPEVGIVLGTGLANLVSRMQIEKEISYSLIPNFSIATVEFHFGKLLFGTIEGKKVIAMQGRFHYYEGYDMDQIVFPIRVMKMLGVKYVLLSNASGAINPSFRKGHLMLVDDHINLQPENPLRGPNSDKLGPRFPDMSRPYDSGINARLREIARNKGIEMHTGVYASVPGPNLETRAEYRYLRIIGADAVGMSTVPEVITCNHMSLPCACVSVLTDECDPDNLHPVDIQDILEVAGKAEIQLTDLFCELISSYSQDFG
jgi:purine-nucleoside phosphorylase